MIIHNLLIISRHGLRSLFIINHCLGNHLAALRTASDPAVNGEATPMPTLLQAVWTMRQTHASIETAARRAMCLGTVLSQRPPPSECHCSGDLFNFHENCLCDKISRQIQKFRQRFTLLVESFSEVIIS